MRGIAGCAIDGEVLHPEPFRRQFGARVRNWGKPRSANLPQGEHGRRGDKPCKLAKGAGQQDAAARRSRARRQGQERPLYRPGVGRGSHYRITGCRIGGKITAALTFVFPSHLFATCLPQMRAVKRGIVAMIRGTNQWQERLTWMKAFGGHERRKHGE